ncbi:MAG TPA: 1,6-anhydro-N-acetylmuramyl-L-alanine amidase AmpD [Thermoanaerobaculia bacterium]|nr:1,6-anhydro-N-acetylmuramyl-L-alanine amidase AmpD [Thermoanaerobaculia bacterium]
MRVDSATGLLTATPHHPSPFQEARPEGVEIELVVVHGISLPPDEFGGRWVDDLFLGRLDPTAHPYFAGIENPRVSAHLFIRRSGAVVQYVPFHRRAWHAGVSEWKGQSGVNDFSVGIEVEGSAAWPYAGAQYRRLAAVLRALAAAYPAIDLEDGVVGHADVAPGRKSDPWPTFDWPRLRRLLDA